MAPLGYMPDIAWKVVAISSWHFNLKWIDSERLIRKSSRT
jgi:hypothetical protein